MRAELDGTTIKIDAVEFVESLNDEARELIAQAICAEEPFYESIVDVIVKNDFFSDEYGGGWWALSPDRVHALREKLLPMMDDVAVAMVKHLLQERDSALLQKNQSDRRYWKLYHSWQDMPGTRPPISQDDEGYVAPDWVEDDEARAMLKKARETMHQRLETK